MSTRFIQSLLFLSICIPASGMNFDDNKKITNEKWAITNTIPQNNYRHANKANNNNYGNKNNNKKNNNNGNYYKPKNKNFSVTPKATQPRTQHPAQMVAPQPVININHNNQYPAANYHPELNYNQPVHYQQQSNYQQPVNYQPEANQFPSLDEVYNQPTNNFPPKITFIPNFNYPTDFVQIGDIQYPTTITYLPFLQDYSPYLAEFNLFAQFPGFNYHPAISYSSKPLEPNAFKKIESMPYATKEYPNGVLKSINQPVYRLLYEQLKKMALQGDTNQQIFIRKILLNKCTPLLNDKDFLLKTQEQEIVYAYELLEFTNTIFKENKFVITPQEIRDSLNSLINGVSNPVAYILTICQYIQAITNDEKHEILKKLIQKNAPDTLYTIASNPLYAIIIEQLQRTQLTASNSYNADLNLAIAELYYYQGSLEQAHKYYSHNSAEYLAEKSASIHPFAANAANAYLASSTKFDQKDMEYLKTLTPQSPLTMPKTNPSVSRGIGLLAQACVKNTNMSPEKKAVILANGINHLEYSQEHLPCMETMAIIAESHHALATIYADINNGVASLAHLLQAFEYNTQTNHNLLNSTLLTMLTRNAELCAQHAQSSIIIEQLERALLTTGNLCPEDLNLALAQLYYYQGNLEAAHKYYSHNSGAYITEKSDSINPFATNAFNACLASTTKFYKKDTQYLTSLVPNLHQALLAIETTNPHISRGIGLLAQTRLKNSPNMSTEKRIAVMLHALDHLKYAQQQIPTQEIMAIAAEFHNALSTFYAVNNDGATSLNYLKAALAYDAQAHNDELSKQLLAILRNNTQTATEHAQWISRIVNLIYNSCAQNYSNTDYAALAQCASSDLVQQLLPLLGDAYRENKHNKNEIAPILALLHCTNGDYDKACTYINFMTHIDEQFMHYFIQHIASQKNMSQILQLITERPACTKIVAALNTITFSGNNALETKINHCLAELCYYSKHYTQAHKYYAQIPKKNLTYDAKRNAFNAYIATTDTFGKTEIDYLSSLFNNVVNQLETIKTTDPKLSYKIGLITHYVINNNAKLSVAEKTELMLNGVNHLEYAQQHGICNSTLTKEFHTQLSALYKAQNNIVAALKHTKHALDTNKQNSTITTALAIAEKENLEFYTKHASVIQLILDFISDQPCSTQDKNFVLLPEFASSNLWQQLLPHCCNNKQANDEIICLMALTHKNNDYHAKACDIIDKLSQPMSTPALWLKTEIYAAAQQTLPDTELETVFKLYSNNKKPSTNEEKIVLSFILSSGDFFVRLENYTLALKLIKQLTAQQQTPAEVIRLTYYITKYLAESSNPYLAQWTKELNKTQWSNFKDPSEYNGDINLTIGLVLMDTQIGNYETIIKYLSAALKDDQVAADTIQNTHELCGKLYCKWAEQVKDDKEKYATLLDRAIIQHNSSKARYDKAVLILMTTDNAAMANHALELLEKNISDDSPEKTLSQMALASTYFNHHPHAARIPILKQLIPLDVPRAMSYLTAHNYDKSLLTTLRNILAGTSIITMTPETQEALIDMKQALTITEYLINMYGERIDELAQRSFLYGQLNEPKKAIENIDRMLSAKDLTNTSGITQETLLIQKIKFLLHDSPDDNSYDQILACFKQLDDQKNPAIELALSPEIYAHTNHIITHKKYDHNNIEWCCFMAMRYLAADKLRPPTDTIQHQKELGEYLLTAAKIGNVSAQLILVPYLCYAHNAYSLQEASTYAHAALCNPITTERQQEVSLLIKYLRIHAEHGLSLPCYVLYDYYQKDRQKREEILSLFSKAKQHVFLKDTTNIVEKICNSCRDTLQTYADPFIANPNQGSRIGAVATLLLGSMYHYADKHDLLTAATCYIKLAKEALVKKYKLSSLEAPTRDLLANIYHKQANMTDVGIMKLNLLRRGAELGLIEFIHEIAEMWIQQQKDGKNDLEIEEKEFLPQLQCTSKENQRSFELLTEYANICDNNKKNAAEQKYKDRPVFDVAALMDIVANHTNEVATTTSNMLTIKNLNGAESMKIIRQHAQSIIKDLNYKEKSKRFNTALECQKQGNLKKAGEIFQEAANKEKHANAFIICSLDCISGEMGSKQDYARAETLLKQALSYGLLPKSYSSTTKQFKNPLFCLSTLHYISILITNNIPQETQSHFLSLFKTTLVDNGIDMAVIEKTFEEMTGIDLTTIPGWQTEEKAPQHKDLSVLDRIAIIHSDPYIKSTLKYPQYLEKSKIVIAGVKAEQKNDSKKAYDNYKKAMQQEKHPNASMYVALYSLLSEDKQVQNYNEEYGLLTQALKYGLVTKSRTDVSKQFHNAIFVNTLLTYTDALLTISRLKLIQQPLLSTIETTLTDSGISTKNFNALYKKIYGAYIPEWETDEEVGDALTSGQVNDIRKQLYKACNIAENAATASKSNCTVLEDPLDALIYQAANITDEDTILSSFVPLSQSTNNTNEDALLASMWSETSDSNAILVKENKTEQPTSSSSLKDSLTKYVETSNHFLDAQQAFKRNKTEYGLIRLDMCVRSEQHPIACLMLAKHDLLHNKTINYSKLEDLLEKSLRYSTEKNQFKTDGYMDALCDYTKTFLSQNPPLFTQKLFFTSIKKALPSNAVSAIDFSELVLEKTAIDLLLYENWNTSTDTKPAPIAYCGGNLFEDMKQLEAQSNNSMQAITKAVANVKNEKTTNNLSDARCGDIIKNTGILESLDNIEKSVKTIQAAGAQIKAISEKYTKPKAAFTYAEQKADLMQYLSENFGEKDSLVNNADYKETNLAFTNGVNAYSRGMPGIGLNLIKQAAEKDSHPIAYMHLATTYLTGNNIQKDYIESEKHFLLGLTYGIQKGKFCNKMFLEYVCNYLTELLNPTHGTVYRDKMLQQFISILTFQGVNAENFCTLFKKEKGIDLLSVPEWNTNNDKKPSESTPKTNNNNNNDEKPVETATPQAKKSWIKDADYKETCEPYILGMEACNNNQMQIAMDHIMTAATQHHHPMAGLFAACHFLGPNTNKNYKMSEFFLKQALLNGLERGQFCNQGFFNGTLSFITHVMRQVDSSPEKRSLLSPIKTALVTNDINPTAFSAALKKAYNIDLSTVTEWQTETEATCKPKKSLIKDLNHKETSDAFGAAAIKAHREGEPEGLNLLKIAVEEHHHPLAAICAAAHYVSAEKNYALSKEFLEKALNYGIIEGQLCNKIFAVAVCAYISNAIEKIDSPAEKRVLFSTIKAAFAKNDINTDEFLNLFKRNKDNLDLSTVAEWQTEAKIESKTNNNNNNNNDQKPTKIIDPLEASLINNPNYEEKNKTFISGLGACSRGKHVMGLGLIKQAAEQNNHPIACIDLAMTYLTGNNVKQNYTESETYFNKGVLWGLQFDGKFCNETFLKYVCNYIVELLKPTHKPAYRSRVLWMFINTLKLNDVNVDNFCKLFKEKKGIDLTPFLANQ